MMKKFITMLSACALIILSSVAFAATPPKDVTTETKPTAVADEATPPTASGEAKTSMGTDWSTEYSSEIPQPVLDAYKIATKGLVGVGYKPMAFLGQSADNTKYCILCQAKVVVPNAKPYYALMFITKDSQGNASIGNIIKIDLAELAGK
ncbi:hypothetical protein [uncultured Anaerovibrio sp.]|uniref:hypothetical protein n=1 Tax=uncultured Anaerovibrio sp. TaxID=361586 RepID=UPI0025E3E238|nr:hypothetical protein [uncultured Anaerovibrio sp.]